MEKGSDHSKSLPEPLAALRTSTLRDPESGRLGPGRGKAGISGSGGGGARKAGTQAPEDVGRESRPSFSPAPLGAESEPRLQTAWGCPLQRKGGVPRGLWWGFEPLPAEAPCREWSSKGSFGPPRCGSGHLRGRREWGAANTLLGQKSTNVGALFGTGGEEPGRWRG